MKTKIHNKRIKAMQPLITPGELLLHVLTNNGYKNHDNDILKNRSDFLDIIHGQSNRIIVMAGPCSIHDTDEAIEYASKLKVLAELVKDKIMIVMRVYFEKPRTTVGWKGLICDPNIDGSDEFASGLVVARTLMSCITNTGLPIVTEFLDPLVPQYIGDLVTTGTIGARTIESQTHRQMASGLSMPIGFKNGTSGSIDFALDAMKAAEANHTFIGIDHNGQSCLISTSGNSDGYLILRGGQLPNFEPSSIGQVIGLMDKRNSKSSIIVDCSHGNSIKDFRRQKDVFASVIQQRIKGNTRIVGLMLESNLFEGNQPSTTKPFKPGISITDSCIGFEETENLIVTAYDML